MTLTSTNNSTIVSRRHSNNQTLPNESSRSMTSTSTTNNSTNSTRGHSNNQTNGTMAEATGAAAAAAIPEEQTDSSTDQTVTRSGTRRAQDKQQVCRRKI
jgi:hypothetical protein